MTNRIRRRIGVAKISETEMLEKLKYYTLQIQTIEIKIDKKPGTYNDLQNTASEIRENR